MLKNIFILVMFFSPSINYCADESKSLDEDEKDLGSISSSIKKTFNFISSEGTTFKVPLKIALQIPLIKAKINYQRVGDQVDYSYDFEENEISKITLGLLANALILFDKFENLE
ncbi:MAG: hypothetical protein P4L22_02565, partial [Candidatus Babeliales bacterium]|nr:hypothetical protein [Candidatus Babeliales bacterium]